MTVDDAEAIKQTVFTMNKSELANDSAYFVGISDLLGGDASMTLTDALTGDGTYSRTISSPAPAALATLVTGYAVVTALPDLSSSSHYWNVPGLRVQGPLPPLPYLQLLVDIGGIVESHPADGSPPAVPLDAVSLAIGLGAGYGADPAIQLSLGVDRPSTVARVARAVAESGVSPISFQYAQGDVFGAVHFGDCAAGPLSGQYDEQFVVSLADAGVPVTVADNLGLCASSEP